MSTALVPHPANRFGLDYRQQAHSFAPFPAGIIDVHSHINGGHAAKIYSEVAKLYGINLTYSMTRLSEVDAVKKVMGTQIRFVANPDYQNPDRRYSFGEGYLKAIEAFYEKGARITKFWSAPRGQDLGDQIGDRDYLKLTAPHQIRAMELASSLGMMFMAHIGDPDTWFATDYKDSSLYGSKREQYEPLEQALSRFQSPWIAAHMGGWPEDLEFLDSLLSRNSNLYLDTSATKWMVRELSKHSAQDLEKFLSKWAGRILFGSDIVTSDMHLAAGGAETDRSAQATNSSQAFDLYASRYWALRTLFETDYDGESPIADPDLMKVNPEKYDAMSAPALKGKSISQTTLQPLYHDAAKNLLEPYYPRNSDTV